MPIVQSDWAKGLKQAPEAGTAGAVVCERYKFTVSANLAVGDIIELACLPAYHEVVDAILIADECGVGTTFDVGLMSGAFGVVDPARTSGAELFSAAADAATTRMSLATGFRIGQVGSHRSIGVKVGATAIVAAGQVIELLLFTKQ